jgi:hypothetical protein
MEGGYMLNLSTTAKSKQREYLKSWRDKNRDKVNAYAKAWRDNNKDKVKTYMITYWERQANK